VISTVDPEARHGRKTSARSYDGYKGNISLDPDSEVITSTTVTAANEGDAGAARELIEDLAGLAPAAQPEEEEGGHPSAALATKKAGGRKGKKAKDRAAQAARAAARAALRGARAKARQAKAAKEQANQASVATPSVYGDAAYGSGELLAYLQENGIDARVKTQPPSAPGGVFTKDRFVIDLGAGTVTCPAANTVPVSFAPGGAGTAHFGEACADCPLRGACTAAKTGRTVGISTYEELLQAQRARCAAPGFGADYKATRPKVERKLAHLMRRRHGGRRARVRGKQKVDADFNLLAAAQNLGRLAVLGLRSTPAGWVAAAR
jgi:type II secretory pathway pseudopilin PulG